jgi:hypothetical protein
LIIISLGLLIRLMISVIKVWLIIFDKLGSGAFLINTADTINPPAKDAETKPLTKSSKKYLLKSAIKAEKIKFITAIIGLLTVFISILMVLLKIR